MKQFELKLSNAEFLILAEVVVLVSRGYRYDKRKQNYFDSGVFFNDLDKKQMSSLRAIARKLGVK